MDLNQLVLLVQNKIEKNILTENIIIKDKTYLHKKHLSHELGKFHLEIRIKSEELNKFSKIQATKKIYKILDEEIKKYIHSIQILIN
jgi:BolA protein